MHTAKLIALGIVMTAAASLAPAGAVPAQETLDEVMERFQGLVDEGNYPKALEELEWARRALEKAHFSRIEAIFPAALAGLEARPVERRRVLGVNTHSRRYVGPSGKALEVTLTEEGGAIGLAALEQLSRLLGVAVNTEPVRIDGRSATLVPRDEAGDTRLTVELESGGMLSFKSSGHDEERVLAAAREFGIKGLDEYLSGDNPHLKSSI